MEEINKKYLIKLSFLLSDAIKIKIELNDKVVSKAIDFFILKILEMTETEFFDKCLYLDFEFLLDRAMQIEPLLLFENKDFNNLTTKIHNLIVEYVSEKLKYQINGGSDA